MDASDAVLIRVQHMAYIPIVLCKCLSKPLQGVTRMIYILMGWAEERHEKDNNRSVFVSAAPGRIQPRPAASPTPHPQNLCQQAQITLSSKVSSFSISVTNNFSLHPRLDWSVGLAAPGLSIYRPLPIITEHWQTKYKEEAERLEEDFAEH
jgi:hypothetical protein